MEDEEDHPPSFGLTESMTDANLLGTPPLDNHPTMDNNTFTARHLENFTKRVLWKATSPLIR